MSDGATAAVARVHALEAATATWDGHDAGRGDALAALARAIGASLGMSGTELVELELAARLHDVGKLRLPASVLQRRGPLTESELALVRMHPAWGADMLRRVPGLKSVAAVVGLHHERMDGQGYPHAIAGDLIPLSARVLAVCDAYAALISERPYRPALTAGAAVAELEDSCGQFDPAVVRALAEQLRLAPAPAGRG
jgi:HD-GYP domain-containing protein (c-di-GMP phosphodiesterase class II)